MSSITLVNLRAAVRSRADMINSQFVDDTTELNRWINECGAELYDEIVSRFEDQYTEVSSNIVVSSGNTLSPPVDFYKLRGVDLLDGDWHPVRMYTFAERNRRQRGYSWYRAREIRYRLVGSSILLTPDDAATGTYRIWYIPAYADLVNDTDVMTFDQNWFEFVIAGAAAKALAKEESDTREQLASKESVRARIRVMASNRDAGGRMRIEDVRTRWDEG